MGILFTDIYEKSVGLFDDPKITMAYTTNKIQFAKLMYVYLQNAITSFNNPAIIGIKLSNYVPPKGTMEIFEGDGVNNTFSLDPDFVLLENSLYNFIEDGTVIVGSINYDNRTVTFPDVLEAGKQYSLEQYFPGEFVDDFKNFNTLTTVGDNLVVGEIKNILSKLLVRSWAEEERNMLTDIRNMLQDSDFKLTASNDKALTAKDAWVKQLTDEIFDSQNKLSWTIRFLNSAGYVGIGRS